MHSSRQYPSSGPGLVLLIALGVLSLPGSVQAEGLR